MYSHLENEVVNFLNFPIEFNTMRIPMEVHRLKISPRDSRWWQRALFQYVLNRKSQLWCAEAGEFSSVHQWCYKLVGSVTLKWFWKPECLLFQMTLASLALIIKCMKNFCKKQNKTKANITLRAKYLCPQRSDCIFQVEDGKKELLI